MTEHEKDDDNMWQDFLGFCKHVHKDIFLPKFYKTNWGKRVLAKKEKEAAEAKEQEVTGVVKEITQEGREKQRKEYLKILKDPEASSDHLKLAINSDKSKAVSDEDAEIEMIFESELFIARKRKPFKSLTASIRGFLRRKSDLEEFSDYYDIIYDPESDEDKAGQAYADMKAYLVRMKKKNPDYKSPFVENHMLEGRLGAAMRGNLAAIQDLCTPDMIDEPRVPPLLARLIVNNHYQGRQSKRQKTAIQSFKKYMAHPEQKNFSEYSGLYVQTMNTVMKEAHDPDSRLLAFEASKKFVDSGFSADQKLTFMRGVTPLLSHGVQALDERASDLIVETFSKRNFKGRQKYKEEVIKCIHDKVTKERVLENLAKSTAFTVPALEKIVVKVKTEPPIRATDIFPAGLRKVTKFFKDNKDVVKKAGATVEKIYNNTISEELKDNASWALKVSSADTEIKQHWRQMAKAAAAAKREAEASKTPVVDTTLKKGQN